MKRKDRRENRKAENAAGNAAQSRQLCQREVDAVLARYGCVIVPRPFYEPDGRGGFFTRVLLEVVSKTEPTSG